MDLLNLSAFSMLDSLFFVMYKGTFAPKVLHWCSCLFNVWITNAEPTGFFYAEAVLTQWHGCADIKELTTDEVYHTGLPGRVVLMQ